MKVEATALPGVVIIEPQAFGDERGFFLETYRAQSYREQAGIEEGFVQDNHSRSRRGVLRGLHYQLQRPQGKLVQVIRGEVFDVAVDIRLDSPTFGQWVGVVLDDIDHRQLYVPPGYAHGFCVLSELADFFYKCTDYYDSGSEHGVLWNDPDIAIRWPLDQVQLSARDATNPTLKQQSRNYLPRYRD